MTKKRSHFLQISCNIRFLLFLTLYFTEMSCSLPICTLSTSNGAPLCDIHNGTDAIQARTVPSLEDQSVDGDDNQVYFDKCVVCNKSLRGWNRFISVCHIHQPQSPKTKRTCIQDGCETTPRNPHDLYCSRHDDKKRQHHIELCKKRQKERRMIQKSK